jgi:ribosome-associated heat shock protein Hsp15
MVEAQQRIDKWLWMARFYKTRAVALEAIKGGHVHVAGTRVKPSRQVSIGDMIEITREIYRWEITVDALATRRGPATEARLLYHESKQSLAEREVKRLQYKMSAPIAPAKKPGKHERKKIIRFINKHSLD